MTTDKPPILFGTYWERIITGYIWKVKTLNDNGTVTIELPRPRQTTGLETETHDVGFFRAAFREVQ